MSKFFCLLLLLTQVTACSLLSDNTVEQVKPPINIEFSSPKHIHFQGKGAGAGIALMSSMGAVGIAIGVAIDEGIAKDIRIVTTESGLLIDTLVKDNLSNVADFSFNIVAAQKEAEGEALTRAGSISIVIKNYGFVIVDGNNDLTTSKWQLQVVQQEGEGKAPNITDFTFPDDYENNPAYTLTSFPLEQVKKEGSIGMLLLNTGLKTIVSDPAFIDLLALSKKG